MLLAFIGVDLALGSVPLSLGDIIEALTWSSTKPGINDIFWEIRFPKAIAAVIAGAALSVSGLLMQTLFRNPVAGPYLLGVTSGAELGLALLFFLGGSAISFLPASWMGILASGGGAVAALFAVMAFARKGFSSNTLLLIGLLLGATFSAFSALLQFFSDAEENRRLFVWGMGSLGGVDNQELVLMFIVVVAAMIGAWLLHNSLNLLLFGETYAESMGANTTQLRRWVVLSSAILAGCVTAFCGPIGFVGTTVPHAARALLKSHNHKQLIPMSALLGALFLVGCDCLCSIPLLHGQTLPINVITSLIGAPLVAWVLLK